MKKIKTALQFVDTFFSFWDEFSFRVAFARVVRDLPFIPWEKRRSIYEKAVLCYMKKYVPETEHTETEQGSRTIWVMWWQGVDGMPPIVKACWNQLNAVTKDRTIVLITKENWGEYVSVPDYISEKVENGTITLTHFSDIVRICLLERYGGLWLDATMWCESIPDEAFSSPLYTLHAPGLFPNFISRGEWSIFCIGTNKSNVDFFRRIRIALFHYWKEHNCLIDYLFIDYLMKTCIETDPMMASLKQLRKTMGYYQLNNEINEPYSEMRFQKMMNDSALQKLTYKKQLLCITSEHQVTNYGYLINRMDIRNDF